MTHAALEWPFVVVWVECTKLCLVTWQRRFTLSLHSSFYRMSILPDWMGSWWVCLFKDGFQVCRLCSVRWICEGWHKKEAEGICWHI